MTEGNLFTVDAQWALQGKTPGRDGYRVLAHSTGSLSEDNFTEAIGRFSMGTPETGPTALPQVTISYLAPGVEKKENYLALAIHRFASDVQGSDGQLMARDDDGRPVVVTSYCCVPYDLVAKHGVSYRDMYQAFAAAPLRLENSSALPVSLPAQPSPAAAPGGDAAFDLLAQKTAALLVLGRPVCVLGAQDSTMADRLAFIDTVMALLPYGFRSRMSAATWTRATNQNHRFRLFFSGARRDAKEPDYVVAWGHPEQTPLTQDDNAGWYLNWLRTGPVEQRLSLLASLIRPRSLVNKQDVDDALDEIDPPDVSWLRARHNRRAGTGPNLRQQDPANGPSWGFPRASSAGERFLLDCAKYLEEPDGQQLAAAVKQLNSVKSAVTADERDRYRELIREQRLFRHNDALGKSEAMLRETLLKIAFAPPLSYADYCLIEDGTGEASVPDSALLELIEKTGTTDSRVQAITYRQMASVEAEKKLAKWYSSKELSADQMLNLLALEVKHPRHMRLLCDVTVEYLRKMSRHYASGDIKRVLRQNSYFARKLQDHLAADQNQYQVNTLGCFLRAAYPDGLTRPDLFTVLIGAKEPPTLPFLAAVLLMLTDPADAFLAREIYIYTSFMTMNLETATSRELERLVIPMLQEAAKEQPAPLERKASGPQPPDDYLPSERGAQHPHEGGAAAQYGAGPMESPRAVSRDRP